MNKLLTAFLLVISAGLPAQEHFSDVKTKTLANGLRVAVKEVPETPLAQIQLTYKVGFRDAPEGRIEMPHFVEHMLFKGTPRYPRDKVSIMVTENGGEINGYTSWDQTSYVELVPSYQVREILAMEASRMTEVAFLPEDFTTEKEVVLSEVRGYAGSQTNKFNLDLFRNLGHNKQRLLDFDQRMEGITAMTREEAVSFYRTWYRPDNALLVVVGDVKADEVFRWAQESFGPIAKPTAPLVRAKEPFQPITKTVSIQGSGIVREPFGFRYFNFQPYQPKSRDFTLLYFLNATGLVPELGWDVYPEGGYLIQNFNQIAPAPLEVLDWKILEQRFSQEKSSLLERRKLGWDELGSIAGVITESILEKEDPAFEDWLTKQFSTVEFGEIRSFLEKYFAPGPNLVGEFKIVSANQESTNYDASQTSDNFTRINDVSFLEEGSGHTADYYRSQGDKAYQDLSGRMKQLFSSIRTITLKNGLKLHVRQSTISEKTWVQFLVPAGFQQEKIPFTASLTADMVFAGGPQLRLQRNLQTKGVGFGGGRAYDIYSGAGAYGPGAQLESILQVYGQALGSRPFHEPVLNAEIEKNLNNFKNPTKDMGYWIRENIKFLFKQAGLTSYDPNESALDERIKATVLELENFYKANYRPTGSQLIITSPFTPEEVAALAEKHLGGWQDPSIEPYPVREQEAIGKVDKEVRKFSPVDKSRENVVHFFQSLATKDYPLEREVLMDLGTSILGESFTGRLFRNLRVKMGLTYGTSAWNSTDRSRSSTLGGYLQASPDNLEKAIAAWKNEIRILQTQGPTEAEFWFTRNKMINARAFQFRNTEAIHSYIVDRAFLGQPLDQGLEVMELLKNADRETLIKVWKEDINPETLLISIAGPGTAKR